MALVEDGTLLGSRQLDMGNSGSKMVLSTVKSGQTKLDKIKNLRAEVQSNTPCKGGSHGNRYTEEYAGLAG